MGTPMVFYSCPLYNIRLFVYLDGEATMFLVFHTKIAHATGCENKTLNDTSSEIAVTNSPAGTAAFLLDTLQEPQPAWIRFRERRDQNTIVMNFFIILFLNGVYLHIEFMQDLFNNFCYFLVYLSPAG